MQGDGETARLTLHPGDLRLRDDLDVRMPGHLDELGGDQAGGAIVGGKGLVQLGHDPADGDILLHQIDLETRIGCVQGGLHAGDAAPYHANGADFRLVSSHKFFPS